MGSLLNVVFQHRGQHHRLNGGEIFAAPREVGFRDTPAGEMREIIRAIESGQPWREIIDQRFAATKPWLHRIVTSPLRTTFFDSVLTPGNGIALDLGAGWGQISRPLAARRPVVAVEPVGERLNFIKAAARQDGVHDNIAFVEADYLEIDFETKFSAVCAIGVLEWAGAFQEKADPQVRQRDFLAKVRRDLVHGGELILGIENRIGLKYLLGCPDDHIGVPNIATLPAALARKRWQESSGHTLRSFTYCLTELNELLARTGFSERVFFGAFPDYKLPERIVSLSNNGTEANHWLRNNPPPLEHNGYDGSPLADQFQETLAAHYHTLAEAGIAHHFAPSFFVRAK